MVEGVEGRVVMNLVGVWDPLVFMLMLKSPPRSKRSLNFGRCNPLLNRLHECHAFSI